MKQLLTCPFCGSNPIYVYRKLFEEWFVSCQTKTCHCMVGRIWGGDSKKYICRTADDAADRWNQSIERSLVNAVVKEI